MTDADDFVDDANNDDDDDDDANVLVLRRREPQLSKWLWRLHPVSTFLLLQLVTRSPVASLLSLKYQLRRCVENAPRSHAVIVSRDHSLTKRVESGRLRTSQLHKSNGKDP